jgi:hypothetical protein
VVQGTATCSAAHPTLASWRQVPLWSSIPSDRFEQLASKAELLVVRWAAPQRSARCSHAPAPQAESGVTIATEGENADSFVTLFYGTMECRTARRQSVIAQLPGQRMAEPLFTQARSLAGSSPLAAPERASVQGAGSFFAMALLDYLQPEKRIPSIWCATERAHARSTRDR